MPLQLPACHLLHPACFQASEAWSPPAHSALRLRVTGQLAPLHLHAAVQLTYEADARAAARVRRHQLLLSCERTDLGLPEVADREEAVLQGSGWDGRQPEALVLGVISSAKQRDALACSTVAGR